MYTENSEIKDLTSKILELEGKVSHLTALDSL